MVNKGINFYNIKEDDKQKFRLSYLKTDNEIRDRADKYFLLEMGATVHIMVNKLYNSTVTNKISLTDSQLKDLVADIETAKSLGYWDREEEETAINECKEHYKKMELFNKMSAKDQKAYMDMLLKSIGL